MPIQLSCQHLLDLGPRRNRNRISRASERPLTDLTAFTAVSERQNLREESIICVKVTWMANLPTDNRYREAASSLASRQYCKN